MDKCGNWVDEWMEGREGMKDGMDGCMYGWMDDGWYKSAQSHRNIKQATRVI